MPKINGYSCTHPSQSYEFPAHFQNYCDAPKSYKILSSNGGLGSSEIENVHVYTTEKISTMVTTSTSTTTTTTYTGPVFEVLMKNILQTQKM